MCIKGDVDLTIQHSSNRYDIQYGYIQPFTTKCMYKIYTCIYLCTVIMWNNTYFRYKCSMVVILV